MKKIKYFIILSLIFFIASCQKDNEIGFYDLGSEFFISGDYTSLDNEAIIAIENQQKNLSEVALTHLGGMTTDLDDDDNPIPFESDYTATIPISAGEGALTISDANLGFTNSAIGWTADFKFVAVYDGKAFSRFYTLEVSDPISFDYSGEIEHRDTTYNFNFSILPVTATVETVSVQTKVGSLSSYTNLAGPFEAEDFVPVNGSDYLVGDTIFFNVIGTVGTKSASAEGMMVVVEPE